MQRLDFHTIVSLALLVAGTLVACQRTKISDDFRSPYEEEDMVLPGATHVYTLTGPRGVAVDIAVDYDEDKDAKTPALELVVQSPDSKRQVAVKVRGAGMKRGVCGVVLEPRAGITIQVQNKRLTKSVPFALRIERSPSPICSPYSTVPSMVLVQNESRRPSFLR